MSEKNRYPQPYGLSKRARRGIAATVFAAGAAVGAVGANAVDDYQDNRAQPACDIEVKPGDSESSIRSRLRAAGDRGDRITFTSPDGEQRAPLYAGEAGVPTLDAIQPGDTAEIKHVDPLVCMRVGGQVIDTASQQANNPNQQG